MRPESQASKLYWGARTAQSLGRDALALTIYLTLSCGLLAMANGFAQTLTVREIMSEPSIAGMRAEGACISAARKPSPAATHV